MSEARFNLQRQPAAIDAGQDVRRNESCGCIQSAGVYVQTNHRLSWHPEKNSSRESQSERTLRTSTDI